MADTKGGIEVEIWRDIVGHEGLYQVSNTGNVRSLNYGGHGYIKALIPKQNNKGRLWIDLRNDGKKRYALVHRLVAEAFIPNPQELPQINHIDENPQNNDVSNLEWCTQSHNIRHSRRRYSDGDKKSWESGKRKQRLDWKRAENAKLPYKWKNTVAQFALDGTLVSTWDNIAQVVRETGFKHSSISACCNGKRRTACGYSWKFISP